MKEAFTAPGSATVRVLVGFVIATNIEELAHQKSLEFGLRLDDWASTCVFCAYRH
jgi:hypothetical protein